MHPVVWFAVLFVACLVAGFLVTLPVQRRLAKAGSAEGALRSDCSGWASARGDRRQARRRSVA